MRYESYLLQTCVSPSRPFSCLSFLGFNNLPHLVTYHSWFFFFFDEPEILIREKTNYKGVGGVFRRPHDVREVKTKTQLQAWNMVQRLSIKCERLILLKVQVASNKIIIRPQKYLCKDKLAQKMAHHNKCLNNSLVVSKRNVQRSMFGKSINIFAQ